MKNIPGNCNIGGEYGNNNDSMTAEVIEKERKNQNQSK